MATSVTDERFAEYVNSIGNATLEQLDAAREVQAEKRRAGEDVSLADVLVEQGILTPAIRQNIEKKLQSGELMQLGAYKLIQKLGEGGMGAVYLAEDTRENRKVAIKLLSPRLASDAEFLKRFRREAKLVTTLKHENIVGGYELGEELGHHFFVMEYCQGQPLDSVLAVQNELPWAKALEITLQVARGLKHAHDHGVVHRDIKPGNIFITSDPDATAANLASGTAKILDLGLCKNMSENEQSFKTATGVIMGTPHYIAPEQAIGAKDIDGRADIYSLGATLYRMVTGQTPYNAGTSALVIMKHLHEQLTNPHDLKEGLPDGLVRVIQKMMAKAPEDRYADCAELIADLERVRQGQMPLCKIVEEKSTVRRARKAVLDEFDYKTRTGFRTGEADISDSSTVGFDKPAAPKGAPVLLYSVIGVTLAVVGFFVFQNASPKKSDSAAPAKPADTSVQPEKPLAKGAEPVTAPALAPVPAIEAPPAPELALDLGNGVKIEMVLVKAGSFMMGSDSVPGSNPMHRVTLTQDFYLGKYEITVAQFRAFVDATQYKTDAEMEGNANTVKDGVWGHQKGIYWRNPGFPQTDTHPACVISRNDALAFVEWASSKCGRRVFLPTEAQWEYAARGPQSLAYPWGPDWVGVMGNVADKSLKATGFNMRFGESPHDDGFPYTAPVGSFPQNKTWCGAFDTAGNVWEWCADSLKDYTGAPATDPFFNDNKTAVIRGNCWNEPHKAAFSSRRLGIPPTMRGSCFGMRVAAAVK
ncbi:MAG TPA: bifunctional serine/threonine-protein kinase/formylglycine-generating enzyme family protein [Planctomycetota bacterium]|nr:bifunctional serine/threonine-protein kinase/formylglycine-generating enzyme family protein [Planctomycetota bacterium]